MPSKTGPRWADTWWGKRTAAVNAFIVIALLLFLAWKAIFP
jgi:hypothetical protein